MVALSVWGLALEPGKKYDLISEYDIHLTGATFGEEVKGEKRSVLKVHTFTFPEGDSDEEDEDDDEEDDEEEEEEEEKGAKKGGKKSPKKAEEEDEDDDDEDDEDIGELRETIVCSLVPGKIEFQNVNIVLTVSEEPVILEVTGENTVYLSGNYVEQELPTRDDLDDMEDDYDLEDVPSDAEIDSDEMDAVLNGEMDEDSDEMDDEEMEVEPKIQEIKEDKPAGKKRAREEEESSPAKSAEPEKKLSKAERKRLNKKLKAENGEAKAAPAPASAAAAAAPAAEKPASKPAEPKKAKEPAQAGKSYELPGGIKVVDTKIGTGPQAKAGKKIGMRYLGRLQSNGKVFDSNIKGKPFHFTLGKGQVIKGWDQGIAGMAVGGERTLIIPPHMAYGNKKTGDIPANSTLIFEVKMIDIA